ncbi:MAG TPA: allantoinase AllB [Longimicrobiales bacterium]|nr:allantoinase AllB [Longimicrobiales bacterium]
MPPAHLLLRSRRVVTPGGVVAAEVEVAGGVIRAVRAPAARPSSPALLDLGDLVLLPGLVDAHVHVNAPGRTGWEGFRSATRAAAAGGITTLVDMPLNAVPATTTTEALRRKERAARGRLAVDVALWGGVVPGNEAELRGLWDAGVAGFKCFLAPSGVDEFPAVGEPELRRALPILAELGAPLLVHAELPGPLEAARPGPGADPRRYATYLASRPPAAEVEAVRLVLSLCREFGARVHIVHVSAAEVLPLLAEAKRAGLPVTAETCPHYLHFAAEDVPAGATEHKCAPPIRGAANRERLWAALADGVLDLVGSDHSPCPPALKRRESGDFLAAWGGIASLQLGAAVVWTGARERGLGVERLAEWMAAAPARLAGLSGPKRSGGPAASAGLAGPAGPPGPSGRKGVIATGADADLVAFDPDAEWTVDAAALHHRHKLTPYAGARLHGVVRATWLRGAMIYDRGALATEPAGRILRRGEANGLHGAGRPGRRTAGRGGAAGE